MIPDTQQRLLQRSVLLSVVAAMVTIALKALAAWLTGSVSFLSDALESVVNLVAAVVALFAIRTAARPPDKDHDFGHGKAEYLSAAVEGGMIFVAAAAIMWTAVRRVMHPVGLEQTGVGLALSTGASLVNLGVGLFLIRAGRANRSIALEADGKHLITDVWTSAGVLVGIVMVWLTGWLVLDPIVALLVGLNILWTGYGLVKRSTTGLLDASLPNEEVEKVQQVVDRHRQQSQVEFHALRTRESGRQRFVYVHMLVPGAWTVQRGHDLSEQFEADMAKALPGVTTFTHMEPREDPVSFADQELGDARFAESNGANGTGSDGPVTGAGLDTG